MRRQGGPASFCLFSQVVVHEWIFGSSVTWQPQEKERRKETAKTKWFLIAANCSKSAQLSPLWKIHTQEQRVKNQHENHQVVFGTGTSQAFQWESSQAFQSNPRCSWGNSSSNECSASISGSTLVISTWRYRAVPSRRTLATKMFQWYNTHTPKMFRKFLNWKSTQLSCGCHRYARLTKCSTKLNIDVKFP